jgi:hypothetical protein
MKSIIQQLIHTNTKRKKEATCQFSSGPNTGGSIEAVPRFLESEQWRAI